VLNRLAFFILKEPFDFKHFFFASTYFEVLVLQGFASSLINRNPFLRINDFRLGIQSKPSKSNLKPFFFSGQLQALPKRIWAFFGMKDSFCSVPLDRSAF